MRRSRIHALVVSGALVVTQAAACGAAPECASMYDCGEGAVCAADGRCVGDERTGLGGGAGAAAPAGVPMPMLDPAAVEVPLTAPGIEGTVGPVDDVRGATAAYASAASDGLYVQLDFATDTGTGFVFAWLPPVEDLRARAAASLPPDDDALMIGAACADTFAGAHYDAAIEEAALTVRAPAPDGSIDVELVASAVSVVGGAFGGLSVGGVTDVRATFTLPAVVE